MENPVEEPMSRLTRDLIAEILSRVPYKSLCICPAWRHLIADPVYRKKIVQSLTGFFYRITDEAAAEPGSFPGVNYADLSAFPWASVPKTHPRLPLPPDSTGRVMSVDDSCDGLFLARISSGAWKFRYMVSNPATAMEPQWDVEVGLCFDQPGVFCNGCLHLLTYQSGLAIVDAQGAKWRTLLLPILAAKGFSGFIGKSAGQLLYIDPRDSQGYGSNRSLTISLYVLSVEIYNWDVSHSHLDDKCMYWNMLRKFSNAVPKKKFIKVIGVHPHANLIFMAYSNSELLAYDLDHRESTIVYHLDHDYRTFMKIFPYVPLLSCLPLDGGIRLATPN
uniref:F-box domain-containing protein n=1 Tax=Aegilops tauschii TaxID=37682 RepID=N1QWY9_AEGTA